MGQVNFVTQSCTFRWSSDGFVKWSSKGVQLWATQYQLDACDVFALQVERSIYWESVDKLHDRMKIAPLGLAGGRSYDRTNSLRTPTMKESQLLREKTTSSVFVSTCSNAVSLTCIHTQHQAMWRRLLAVETLPIDRWHDRPTGKDLRARSIAIEVKHETLPANRTRLLAAPVDLLACSRRRHCSPTRDGHQPVMTGHKYTTTKDRSRKKAVMAALWSFLLDRLDVERSILRFPSPLHSSEVALRILAKGNWKIDSFLWGGTFGRSLLCPGRAEKKTRGSWPTTGCLPVDRNKLGHDSWRDEKGVWYRTHRHTHELKRRGPPGPRR